WRSGEADPKALQRRGMEVLKAPGVIPGYLELVDEQLRPVARADARTVVVIAAQVGPTRLIDNVVLGEGVAGDISVRASCDTRAVARARGLGGLKDAVPGHAGRAGWGHRDERPVT